MKRLVYLLVGSVLCPCAMAGVAILSTSVGGGSSAGAFSGATATKSFLLETGGPTLPSPKALVGNAALRRGNDIAMPPQGLTGILAARDDVLSTAHGTSAGRQVTSLPTDADSSHESYAMMAAGLCAIGFLARRRRLV